ncbi:MAG: CPBP family intramembrane glutamic endopeptidase [Pseudomonadota bacterium]
MSYEPHEHLVAPARVQPDLWRLAVGAILGFAVYLMFSVAYFAVAELMIGRPWIVAAFDATQPSQVYFLLGSFLGMLAGAICAAILHQRGLRDLIGGYIRFARDGLHSLVGVLPIVLVLLVFLFITEDIVWNLPPVIWVLILPISIGFLILQVAAEEIVFRGYLQSQLAALNVSPVLWILIPSVLFGMAHFDTATLGQAAPWVVGWAILFGILAADLTARTGSLGAATAFHFTNNFVAMLVLGMPDHLGGLALFHYPFSITASDEILTRLPQDAFAMVALYLAIRLRLKV